MNLYVKYEIPDNAPVDLFPDNLFKDLREIDNFNFDIEFDRDDGERDSIPFKAVAICSQQYLMDIFDFLRSTPKNPSGSSQTPHQEQGQ